MARETHTVLKANTTPDLFHTLVWVNGHRIYKLKSKLGDGTGSSLSGANLSPSFEGKPLRPSPKFASRGLFRPVPPSPRTSPVSKICCQSVR